MSPSKAAWAAHAVHPLGPLRIQSPVRLLVLWFEDADRFSLSVLDKVASARPLIYSHRVHSLINSILRCPNELREGGVIYKREMISFILFQTRVMGQLIEGNV